MTNPPSAFWDRLADRYAARPVDHPDAYEATLERVRAHLTPEDRVLELGCGTGTTAIRLAPGVAHYRATDFSPRMIEIARAKPEAQALPQLSFAVAGADEMDGAPWDAVLAFNLLQLLDDLPGTLGRIHGALKPGGLFLSKSTCLKNLGLWLRVVIPALRAVGYAPPLRFLGIAELERAVRDAGFEIVESGDYPEKRAARFIVARRV